jgi:hypothetical protein
MPALNDKTVSQTDNRELERTVDELVDLAVLKSDPKVKYEMQQRQEIIDNQKELVRLLKEPKEKKETFYDSIPEKLRLKISGVINDYDEFYNDLPLLIEYKFIEIKNEQLYCDNKSFLHDYFKDITPTGKNTKWESVHNLFGIKGLNTAKSIDKKSRFFEKWKSIKQDISTCI